MGIFSIWQVIDKQGYIHIFHTSPVLRPQFHGSILRQHKLPAISSDMIINAHLQRIQKRGFSVISAANDQGNSLWNCHSPDFSPMWQHKGPLHGSR